MRTYSIIAGFGETPGREHSGLELIRGLHNLRERHHGSVVTIGAFDGVHRGHQAVISDLLGRSREFGLPRR